MTTSTGEARGTPVGLLAVSANDRIRITPSLGEFDRPIWDTTDEESFRVVA